MWHVSSRSGVATLRTTVHLLLTYLRTYSMPAGFCRHFVGITLRNVCYCDITLHTYKILSNLSVNTADQMDIFLNHTHTQTHTHLMAFCPGLPGQAGTRKVKPIWILLKQETVSSSGICWAICKSAHRSRQITMPTPHHSVFYRQDALPAAKPTVSRQ